MILQIMQLQLQQPVDGGASGSVYIKGKGITSLTFDIYVRGWWGTWGIGLMHFFWYLQYGC
jgi:hypothetical protein